VVLVVLGALTALQCAVWRDSESLWTQAIAVDPRHPIAYYNRGADRFERGDAAGALSDFEDALRWVPKPSARFFANRGAARASVGDWKGALEDCNAALKLDPRMAEAHATAGDVLRNSGDFARARQAYERARDLSPHGSGLRAAMQKKIDELSR
jgi:tetratricopeptide (TPR) repeat protein